MHESRQVQVEYRINFRLLGLLWEEVARGLSESGVLVEENEALHEVLSSFKGRFRDAVMERRRRAMISPLLSLSSTAAVATTTGDGGKKTGLIPMHMVEGGIEL